MDRIAIISDIHGNLPALEAVLKDIEDRDIKKIFCLGDLAGKGPKPAEVVDKLRSRCEFFVKGNWDYFLSEQKSEMLLWTQKELGAGRIKFMKNLPIYIEFYMSGKLVRLCHASPHSVFDRTYIDTDKFKRIELFNPTKLNSKHADIVGYGDIHSAHVDNFDKRTIFNPGSVGNPLDMPMASYAIIEGYYDSKIESSFSITIVKVIYDIELAIKEAEETDMPEKNEYIKELLTGVYRGRK